ncbi:MAG: CoA pyrophosphatase [Desulfamplus sp.]|nr:CoA pyrophosphatase [Desulfamplus sp.]
MLLKNSGCHALLTMAVKEANHPEEPNGSLFQPTSVMALFSAEEQEIKLILIQKADIKGYPWRNQMAFPGGNCDPEDPTREATALRELEEEMAIPSEDVDMIGSIGHFQTINNKDIEAFLGIWKKMGDIRFDTSEISKVFKIPLIHLIKTHQEKNFTGRLPGLYELTYPYEDVVIWGVTAKIIHHLMEILIPRVISSCYK